MSLISKAGRRTPRARLALAVVYLLLIAGSITTLYPFVMMISTGFKGAADQNDDRIVPQYLTSFAYNGPNGKLAPESLYGKYLLDKYSGDQNAIDSSRIGGSANAATVAEYERFLASLPVDDFAAGFRTQSGQVSSRLAELYQDWLKKRYETIQSLNIAYIDENNDFHTVAPPNEMLDRANWRPVMSRKYREWLEFKAQLPPEFRIPIREQWMFQKFLRAKYQNQLSAVPPEILGKAKTFEEIEVQTESDQAAPSAGALKGPRSGLNPESSIINPQPSILNHQSSILNTQSSLLSEFRSTALPARYAQQTVERLWAMHHRGPLPIEAYERSWAIAHAGSLRSEFAGRNYRFVTNYMVVNGRALWNTVLFCVLSILTQLTINPLAAYALSRYPIRASGKILLFLLATMAFPAEVAVIPSFLLLKQLGLLNTFAALVLPTAASGYMIFLLKGFFDSLPPELFEAGQIDGAKETTMMLRITLPMSRPVLGYLALVAFMGAYGAFMYAFLVAQDHRVWTVMVWIYDLQSYAPKAVVMAALVIAALPTLIVFLAAQRVIMEGIILPNEK